MSEHDVNWNQVSLLQSRQAYLNQLRVGAIQVYLIVVAAVLALLSGSGGALRLDSEVVMPLGCCLLSVGILVFIFDLRCRARSFAVAREMSALVRSAQNPRDIPVNLASRQLFDEDFVFAAIAMIVNSTLLFVLLDWAAEQILGYTVTVILALVFLLVQASLYLTQWPRLSKKMSAWPDGFTRDGDITDISDDRHVQNSSDKA
jgi:hypothetical protein